MIEYVNGFYMDKLGWVALIEKNRPAWQAGKLNGIGGKIEPGETPAQAMRREFREEAGVDVPDWKPTIILSGEEWKCHFFLSLQEDIDHGSVKSLTDEPVHLINMDQLPELSREGTLISNIPWLIDLSLDPSVQHPVTVAMKAHSV